MLEDRIYNVKLFLYEDPEIDRDVEFYQNDTETCTLNINLFKDRKTPYLVNGNVTIIINKNDNTTIVDVLQNLGEGKYTYTLPNNAINVIGNHSVTIQCTGFENDRISFKSFKYKVRKEAEVGNISSQSEYPILTTLISDTNKLNQQMNGDEETRKTDEEARKTNESSRTSEFDQIKEDYNTYKNVMISESNVAYLQSEINNTNSQLAEKLNKDGIVSMANLGTDIKTAMTGGSVPVVGIGSVGTENIKQESITPNKIAKTVNIVTNLFNKLTVTKNQYIKITGELVTYSNETTGGVTDFLPVSPNATYKWFNKTSLNGVAFQTPGAWYDENKTLISPTIYYSTAPEIVTIKPPTNARYLRINYGYQAFMENSVYLNEVFDEELIDFPWLKIKSTNLGADVLSLINNTSQVSKYKGKKLAVLGDSITYGYGLPNRLTESYVYLVGNELSFGRITNYGMSGTLIAKENGYVNSFAERYNLMYNDEEVIIVFGGTNDYYHGTKFGIKESVDITEFYGALNVMMQGLLTRYAGKEVIFMTPMNSYFDNHSSDIPNPNTNKTLKDYRDAIIERCEYYSIPYIDLFTISGMDIAHNTTHRAFYSQDGVHLNAQGNRRMADRIKSYLLTI